MLKNWNPFKQQRFEKLIWANILCKVKIANLLFRFDCEKLLNSLHLVENLRIWSNNKRYSRHKYLNYPTNVAKNVKDIIGCPRLTVRSWRERKVFVVYHRPSSNGVIKVFDFKIFIVRLL